MPSAPFSERDFIRQFEAARSPEQLANFILEPTLDQERALRTYLGTARFQRMRSLAQSLSTARSADQDRPNVVILPGIMGSELTVCDPPQAPTLVWISYDRIFRGGLDRLRLDAAGTDTFEPKAGYSVRATNILNKYYGEIVLRLGQTAKARAFWYDWRKSLSTAAADLEHFLRTEFKDQSVTLVGHSMGGLVARTLMQAEPRVKTKDGVVDLVERLVMLGTPNYGSFEIPQIFAGIQDTVRQLIRLSGGVSGLFNSAPARERLLDVIDSFPGIYHLLPWPGKAGPTTKALYQVATYAGVNAGVSQTHLTAALDHHNLLNLNPVGTNRMVYVAGYGEPTVTGLKLTSSGGMPKLDELDSYQISLEGDGKVPHALGRIDGVPTYAVRCSHGDLARDQQVLSALNDLITNREPKLLKLDDIRSEIEVANRGIDASKSWKDAYKQRQQEDLQDFEDLLDRLKRRNAPRASLNGEFAPVERLSPDEREVEERLLRPFLGGFTATSRTASLPDASPLQRPKIKIRLVREDVVACHDRREQSDPPVDVIAGGIYAGVRPTGALYVLDKAVTAHSRFGAGASADVNDDELLLSGLIERGTARGDLGVPFLVPDCREPARIIALVGLGPPGRGGRPEVALGYRELCWTIGRLGRKHLATLLIGAGAGNLSVEEAVIALLDGVAQGLAAAQGRGEQHLAVVTIVEYYHDRLLEIDRALKKILCLRRPPADRPDAASAAHAPRRDSHADNGQVTRRIDVEYAPLTSSALETHLREGRELREKQLKKDYEHRLQELTNGTIANIGSGDPTPTRVTFSLEQGVYTFGAVTAEASIPQRIVEVNTGLVEKTNDRLVAAEDWSEQRQIGRVLGRLLIPEDLRPQFSTNAPLVMQVDSRSARVHWEMVVQDDPRALRPGGSDEGEFLGLERGFTRQLRTSLAPTPEPPAASRRLLRVLVVADPAVDARLPGAGQEAVEVADLFEAFNRVYDGGVRVEVRRMFGPSEAAMVDVLGQLMLEPFDILHYAGHCFFDKDDPSASGLLFRANPRAVLSARELRRCDRVPRFVFMNACESGITPDRPDERQAAMTPSFAEAFFERGVANFICTGWPVNDVAARLFARQLYAGLLGLNVHVDQERRTLTVLGALPEPLPLYKALHEARKVVSQTRGGNRTWGAYQHYGNPHTRFFHRTLRPRPGIDSHPVGVQGTGPPPPPAGERISFEVVRQVINRQDPQLRQKAGVIEVRPGFLYQEGRSTGRPAVVVVAYPTDVPAVRAQVGAEIDGVPIDVTPATPAQQLGITRGATTAPLPGLQEDLLRPGDLMTPTEPVAEERRVPYSPPNGVPLNEVNDAMSVTCHVSPDRGWEILSSFLARTEQRLTVGMYDLSAPHVVGALRAAVRTGGKILQLVLDPGLSLTNGGDPAHNAKAEDVTEDDARDKLTQALGKRFKFMWAGVKRNGKTTDGIFPTSYHIKVAVRDGTVLWLSSGNWQSSNQPADKTLDRLNVSWSNPGGVLRVCNREWHVIVEHAGLAETFEKFLRSDWDQAQPLQADNTRAFAPEPELESVELIVPDDPDDTRGLEAARRFDIAPFSFTARRKLRVQPLLTPDNYAEHAIRLIESAREKLYFQNQYINLSPKPHPLFVRLLEALKAKVNDPQMDTRVILRDLPEARERLEALEAEGFKMAIGRGGNQVDRFRLQKSTHTKGIIVDDQVVLVGSHNWSSFGTTLNRDASLIFFDSGIAAYYRDIFLHDWEHLARQRVKDERTMPRVVRGDSTRGGADGPRVPWGALYED